MREEVALKINLPESRVQVNLYFPPLLFLLLFTSPFYLFTPLPSFLSFLLSNESLLLSTTTKKIDSAGKPKRGNRRLYSSRTDYPIQQVTGETTVTISVER